MSVLIPEMQQTPRHRGPSAAPRRLSPAYGVRPYVPSGLTISPRSSYLITSSGAKYKQAAGFFRRLSLSGGQFPPRSLDGLANRWLTYVVQSRDLLLRLSLNLCQERVPLQRGEFS